MIEKMGLNVDYFRGIAIGLGACGAATGHRVAVGLAVILYGVAVVKMYATAKKRARQVDRSTLTKSPRR